MSSEHLKAIIVGHVYITTSAKHVIHHVALQQSGTPMLSIFQETVRERESSSLQMELREHIDPLLAGARGDKTKKISAFELIQTHK